MKQIYYQNHDGCEKCNHSGIIGRTAVIEMIRIDDECLVYIASDNKHEWHQYLRENGWEDFKDNARHLCRRGIIDPFSAERSIGGFSMSGSRFCYTKVRNSVVKNAH